MKFEITENEAGQRVDKLSRKLLSDVPLGAIYKSIRKGDIRINGKKTKVNNMVSLGDILEVKELNFEIKKNDFQKVDNNIKVTFEDDNILIVEKWPGVLVHSNKQKGKPTLTDYVLSYLFDKGAYKPEKELIFSPAPCNRLDRNTSGLVIYGKNAESLRTLNEMVRDRKIKKYYMALVKGRIKDGKYEAYILKDQKNNISKVFDEYKPQSKEIAMNVTTKLSCGSYSLIEIELITGRSHQLRAHLSHLGNYIIGDNKYGNREINSYFFNKYGLSYQYLYAYKLNFSDCPEKFSYMENKTITESLPPIFKKIKKDVFKELL